MKQYNTIIAALLINSLVSPITNAYAQTDLPIVRAVMRHPTDDFLPDILKGYLQ